MSKVLPLKHLSARVPWHDNKWNGKTCCDVLDNSFCRILPRIDGTKDPDVERSNIKIDENSFPPCIAEKGTFLSPFEYTRELFHSWVDINPLFKDFGPGIYHHKPFSFNAIPFLWMMKSKGNLSGDERRRDPSDYPHKSNKAEIFEIDYNPDLENQVDEKLGFEGNIWVQHHHNQKSLLDAFFGCLQKKRSLIFFYCKHTPLSEPNERVIVGVAKVREDIGPILEYIFDSNYRGHKSHPWDRCVEHTLTDKNPDGFLLPYHEILQYVKEQDLEIDLREYAAFAPDLLEFSFASELVEHDTAIDALLNMAESLRKSALLLGKSFDRELKWIDNEISKIWDMRGAFPGMGAVLSSLGIAEGNSIAWEIEKYLQQKDGNLLSTNPWNIFEESIILPDKYIKTRGHKLFNKTTQKIWNSKPSKKKELYKLLSRCTLNNEQAEIVINQASSIGTIEEITDNLYLVYEKTRFKADRISFQQVDKALLPPEKVINAFPLPEAAELSDNLDSKRVRALTILILEEATSEGHSLLSFEDVLERLKSKSLNESFPINEDILESEAESGFFKQEIDSILPYSTNPIHFFKLQRLMQIKEIIRRRINPDRIISRTYSIDKDWLCLVNSHPKFPELKPQNPDDNELLAREEKAEALKILTNYPFSVLIGPAGSGKTSLLEIFEQQPEIQKGGVLKLAPTGKARVKLGHDAKTIAQFLYPLRYDAATGNYHINEDAQKFSSSRNVIVDEASMLTEEQLAALLDALGPLDRLILVGDYRQLPPIGTGRPFVDIVNAIKPQKFQNENIFSGPAYAELRQIRRQTITRDNRWDVSLSRCFSEEPSKADLETFHSLASGSISSEHIRIEKWYESEDFRELFKKLIEEELQLDATDIIKSFNRRIGAKDSGDYQYFNYNCAEKEIENWQVISPVNGYGYGVKEINKFIQTTYRKPFIDLALNPKPKGREYNNKRRVAKPKGSDNIVYGDKVINLRNTKWEDWQWIKPKQNKNTALKYIANGEIGVITGEFRRKDSEAKGEPAIEIAFSTQIGYSYVFWPNQLKEEGKYTFDLAYAITIHKAQGSGFNKVFFVLPSKGAILSRELLYTALTRQKDKIIILHQGDFRDFIRLASTDASATARRFTDLFFLPVVKQLNNKWYDARYINISERGEPMLSKSEVIIANCLNKYKNRIFYAYEDKLKLDSYSRSVKPDFTIENLETNKRFYWEHLGMMTKCDYREKWQKKLDAYLNDGYVLHNEAKPTDEKILIITEDNPNGGINSKEIDNIVKSKILEEYD